MRSLQCQGFHDCTGVGFLDGAGANPPPFVQRRLDHLLAGDFAQHGLDAGDFAVLLAGGRFSELKTAQAATGRESLDGGEGVSPRQTLRARDRLRVCEIGSSGAD